MVVAKPNNQYAAKNKILSERYLAMPPFLTGDVQ
jgi:hypothetical protein